MYKKLLVILLLPLVFFLVSCEKGNYTKTEHTLNGYDVYIYDSEQEICAEWYSMGVEIDDETIFNLINLCPLSYVVRVDNEYVGLYNFIRENDVSREELEKLDYGYFTVTTSIENVLEINLNEFSIDSIVVRELNNEMIDGPEWDTKEMIDLSIDVLRDDIAGIFAEPLWDKELCEEGLCRSLYDPSPMEVVLVNDATEGQTKLVLEIYEEHINVTKYLDDEFVSVIYNIRTPSENIDSLYEKIYQRYLEMNE